MLKNTDKKLQKILREASFQYGDESLYPEYQKNYQDLMNNKKYTISKIKSTAKTIYTILQKNFNANPSELDSPNSQRIILAIHWLKVVERINTVYDIPQISTNNEPITQLPIKFKKLSSRQKYLRV